MKVEKCPLCGTEGSSVKTHGFEDRWLTSALCPCAEAYGGLFKLISILRFNRWARREARRIAKEGATK